MTGSFLFVKPSDPKGEIKTAYSDPDNPRYPYDHASWEWLLERTIRRTLLPRALTESHSRETLSGLEDKYSMHRWGSYGVSYAAGSTPTAYQSVGGPGSIGRKTDSDLSFSDRNPSETKVAYGVVDLEEAVALLPFSLEWLHPEWSKDVLDAWDLTAETTETTSGSCSADFVWTWETTVEHTPYDIPDKIPFKCLSHMCTDDDLVTVEITNDDNETIKVKTAPTPAYVPRTLGGSIREFQGTQVRSAIDGAAYKAGWALSEFFVQYRHGLDYGSSTSSGSYGRDGKTSESYSGDNPTLGCLVDIPDKDEYIAVSYGGYEARFIHDFDWDGKQTWWHANDFPKGLDSVLSPKLRGQLKILCPACQPSIPPAVPAFWEKFPTDTGHLQWDNPYCNTFLYYFNMHPRNWMRHLALACTPLDMSARLDAMTTTVHRVPKLFAKIRTVTTTYSTSRDDYSSQSYRTVVTVEGTSLNPIPTEDSLLSVSGEGSGVDHAHGTVTRPGWGYSWSSTTQYTWGESFESNSGFLVCLRSTYNTAMSTKITTKASSNGSESESSYGELPGSYDPDPDDLLFPDWVLPWIETAELFASIESRLGRLGIADNTYSHYAYVPKKGEGTTLYSGDGSGSRTHRARRKIVSLGEMDTSTGRFPELDAAALLSEVDPDPDEPTSGGIHWSSRETVITETTDKEGNTTHNDTYAEKGCVGNNRSRSVSYYVVVKWKFDRTDPETLAAGSPLADLYRKLADAKKALSDKKQELSDARSALSSAQSYKESAEAALASAQEQQANPESAESVLLEEAQAALDRANQALSDAKSKTAAAQLEYAEAEGNMQSAGSNMQSAQAKYDAAVNSGTGVEEAQTELESAYTAHSESAKVYAEASRNRDAAVANEATAQQAVNAAQEYYDTLHDKIEEILQKAVDDAQAAVDEATSRVSEWEQKVSEIENEIPGLEAAVEAAEAAVEAAKKDAADARGSVS